MHRRRLRLLVVMACLLICGQPSLVLACEFACGMSSDGDVAGHHQGGHGARPVPAADARGGAAALPATHTRAGHCAGAVAASSGRQVGADLLVATPADALRPVTTVCAHDTGLVPARMSERNRLAPPPAVTAAVAPAVVAPSLALLAVRPRGLPWGRGAASEPYPLRI